MIIQKQLSSAAKAAMEKIEALREYPVPATEKAIQRVLANLGLQDLTDVTSVIFQGQDVEDSGSDQ